MALDPARFTDAEALADWLIARVGRTLRVGAPLGLGKAATLMNALYRRACADPSIDLTFITALSLDVPAPSSDLERRLMDPIVERVFGDYPGLDYLRDLRRGALPDNITVSEFFFQPGAMLGNSDAQRHYRSVNYTHAGRELMNAGVNVLMQMVAPGTQDDEISLSCNTDVTLDLLPVVERMREAGDAPLVVAQINRRLPTMTRSALVSKQRFDAVFEGEAADFKPFGAPAAPVPDADYAIAARVAALVPDGGTLQIGIGSLSDAIAYCLSLRHNDNARYRRLIGRMPAGAAEKTLVDRYAGREVFQRGLYGCTEMLVDAYLHLHRAGVIKRAVYADLTVQTLLNAGAIDDDVGPRTLTALLDAGAIRAELSAADVDYLKSIGVFHSAVDWSDGRLSAGDNEPSMAPNLADRAARSEIEARCLGTHLAGPTLVHGGFFLGPNDFYQRLRDLDPDTRERFHMTSVGAINHLYGDEPLKRAQRHHARFVNTALKASLDGAVASDGLESGQVLSGVGGQYNFVAQAQELEGARSILCLRAVRSGPRGPESNIVARYGYNTIPRHLRDIVVTEYGVADLRGKTDEDVAIALIEIADARFQDELRASAIAAGKLSSRYRIPPAARGNTPAAVHGWLTPDRDEGLFPPYPYSCDFTETELALIGALRPLGSATPLRLAGIFARNAPKLARHHAAAAPYLERMNLAAPKNRRERWQARLVTLALLESGALGRD
ncbi:acetyl-CoA hydrolase/transferase C-terminal domain-containing protein [Salinisphaera hydrothermalis]|uniref:acetyl-CoA hydrolase/transferase C-terminal domain-containing protein n=1 Tax=Salinisphaera hydrothermalis TaxID=563188 RepID=UPI0033426688